MDSTSINKKLPKDLSVVWLRNDLRIQDNPALYHASQFAKQSESLLVCVFFVTQKQWETHSESPKKLGLMYQRLAVIQKELASYNIPFLIFEADYFHSLPQQFCDIFSGKTIRGVWFNCQYGLNEVRLDQAFKDAVYEKFKSPVHRYHGEVILAPGDVLNQQQSLYQIFTPFAKSWYRHLTDSNTTPFPAPNLQAAIEWDYMTDIPKFGGAFRDDLWPSDSKSIYSRLEQFVQNQFLNYQEARDIPSLRGTSVLSTYLAIGALGVRECIRAVQQCYPKDVWLQHQWITELAWRDFYRHWLASAPRLSQGRSFKAADDHVQWRQGKEADDLFDAWCEGKTGFPIVDAGMRQLSQTGWMHNRLRMVTASFLSKLLLVDWRRGEAFFMTHLMDGDFSSNNGGWQWAASVGTDAVPYFRIFNPYRQSERFDRNGDYIKRFIPELKTLINPSIHCPTAEQCKRHNYPSPIVDYRQARQLALQSFEVAFKK